VILDSSAIIALLLREPAHEGLLDAIAGAPVAGVGAPTITETGIVLNARIGAAGRTLLTRFLDESGVVPVSYEGEHARVAIDAFGRFGKGRHTASLNFGDCMTYATAKLAGRPLLCVGEDFAKTDLELV